MKQATAALFGFLAASVLPAAYLAVAFPLSGERDVQSVLLSAFVFYFFAAVATAIFGLPTYLVLKRFNLVTWWSAVGCGALAGALTIAALTSNFDPTSRLRFTLLGAAAGLLFWSVWRVGRT